VARWAFYATHNVFLARAGLEYISARWLVFISSVTLVFRAARAAVVPPVPLTAIRRNVKQRGVSEV
jgi:hypothetical protein